MPLSVEDPLLCGAADTPRTVASMSRKIDMNTSVRLIFFNLVSVPAGNAAEGLRLDS